ncbi:MAG: TRAP transporter substrate-binding protein DctP [Burkholderiales bacterium]|nr:TRAP transporter substrate-binding protein DctP [Burkholderiales bacterium]
MKRKLLTLVLAASPALLLIPATAQAQQEITLRIGAGHPTPALAYVLAHDTFFIPEVEKRAKAKNINVRFVKAWAGTVAKVDGIVEATQKGTLDIGLAVPVFEPTRLGLFNFGNHTPFGPTDHMIVARAATRMIKEVPALKDGLKAFNAEPIGMQVSEQYGMTLKNDFAKLDDLKGRKIASGAVNAPWSQAIGMVPVALPVTENYQAMQTGLIDGNIYFISGMAALKFAEIAKVYFKTDFGSVPGSLTIMNLDTRRRLPRELNEIIDQVSDETAVRIAEIGQQRDRDVEKSIAGKVRIATISPEDKRRWAEALRELPGKAAKELDGRGLPGTQVYRTWHQFLRDAGHKFAVEYTF